MAIIPIFVDGFITSSSYHSTYSNSTNYNFDCSSLSNAVTYQQKQEDEAEVKWRQVLASRKAAAALVRQYAERLKPVLLVFRRFDWRSAPRWSSLRWRSST